jgi:PAS domain S-box-containing protein
MALRHYNPNIRLDSEHYKQLTTRNTLLSIALYVTPFLVLFFVINSLISSMIKEQIYSRLAQSVRENVQTIQTFLEDRETDLKAYTRLDIDRVEDITRFAIIFRAFIEEKEWYDFISFADMDGRVIFSTNTDLQGSIADKHYFQISREGNPYISGIFYSDILKTNVMIMSYPLYNLRDGIVGVLSAGLNLKNFYDLLQDIPVGETSELFLVNSEGNLLSPTKLGGGSLIDSGFFPGTQNPHTGSEGIKTHLDYRGKRVLCSYRKLGEADIYLVSEMDLDEALVFLKNVNHVILIVFLPFLVILILISNLNSRRITGLFHHLTKNLGNALRESRAKKMETDSVNKELERQFQESRHLALELKASEEYIRNLVDSISLVMIGLDLEGRITHYNRKTKEFSGLDKIHEDESLFNILPWKNDTELREAFGKAVSDRTPQKIDYKSGDFGKGEEFFNLSFFPLEDREGQGSGISFLMENVTERKKLRDQMSEYEKLSALSQLAMGAAHEINNPLLGISSFLELLSEETQSVEQKEEIQFVLQNVYRISETVRGLLNFARPTPPQFTRVNLNHLVEETLSFLGHQPIFRKLEVVKELDPSLPPITADLNQVRQVLINLLINAAQSMPDGGGLSMSTSKVKFEEKVLVEISDTGTGIPPEIQKKIFDPFFTTKKTQGTGLGLSISLSTIKSHDGHISVRSRVGEGTTFTIVFPIRQKGRTQNKNEEIIE